MENTKHLGSVTILTTDRHLNTADLQKILTDQGSKILARLGVNIAPHCVEHCTGLITLAVAATEAEIAELTAAINKLTGISAKAVIMA